MPTRLCAIPTCPEPAAYRGRCGAHASERNREAHDPATKRLYNSKRWKLTRRHVLFDQPLCECGRIATDVHHRVSLSDGGDPYALANLEALCHSCHSRRTRLEQQAWPHTQSSATH